MSEKVQMQQLRKIAQNLDVMRGSNDTVGMLRYIVAGLADLCRVMALDIETRDRT